MMTIRQSQIDPFIAQLWRDSTGAIAIEFALILPVLILLLVGLIDYGGLAIRERQIESAARAGAQYALVEGNAASLSDIEAAVLDDLGAGGAGVTVSISYSYLCPDGSMASSLSDFCDGANTIEPGYYMILTVSENYDLWLAYPFFPTSQNIDGEATVRVIGTN